MGAVLVFMERSRDNQILPASLEALDAGKTIADAGSHSLAALVVGAGVDEAVETLRKYPVDEVLAVDNPHLASYQPELFTQGIAGVCREIKPDYLIMAETLQSIDLAPRLAFTLDTGLVTGCVDLEFDAGQTLFIKPVYSGNVMAAYAVEGAPCMATFRAKSFQAPEPDERRSASVKAVDAALDRDGLQINVQEQVFSENGQGLELAEIVVSGGRGLGGPEGFEILRALAQEIGGTVGASRPPCDLGWIEPSAQVGITGAIVAPDLYFAIGISGSAQHVGGMEGAKTVIAINDREDAPIFKIADYGVVDDYAKVLPELIEGLRQSK